MRTITSQKKTYAVALAAALLPSLRAQDHDPLASVRKGEMVLREGLRNDPAVRRVQELLQTFLRSIGDTTNANALKADGTFGPRTRGAVESFQRYIVQTPRLQAAYREAVGHQLHQPDHAVGRGTVAALLIATQPQTVTTQPESSLPAQFCTSLDRETRLALQTKLREVAPNKPFEEALTEYGRTAGITWTKEQIASLQGICGLPTTGVIDQATGDRVCDILEAHWYSTLVCSTNSSYKWNSAPGAVNIVGLRGFTVESGRNANTFNEWNDTITIVRYDKRGVPSVTECRATTDPGRKESTSSPDVNGDGRGDVAHLIPGQTLVCVGPHKGKDGAFRPRQNSSVYRDTNNNGVIDPEERSVVLEATGVNIHWVSNTDRIDIGGESLGCQVPRLSHSEFKSIFSSGVRGQVHYTLIDMSVQATSLK